MTTAIKTIVGPLKPFASLSLSLLTLGEDVGVRLSLRNTGAGPDGVCPETVEVVCAGAVEVACAGAGELAWDVNLDLRDRAIDVVLVAS